MDIPMRAGEILREALGDQAAFREGQLEAILSAVEPGCRVLIVQRTGWGKSLIYLIATRILRESNRGPTLLVSPLLSLMRNQIELGASFGVRATSINSTNVEDWPELERQVAENEVDLLLISPERLGNPDFRDRLLAHIEPRLGLLVIDEAHCISDWGHDFRPDYRRIMRTVERLPKEAGLLATTATANDRVIADIREQLGEGLAVHRGPLMRESLRLRVYSLADQAERLALLAQFIPKLEGTGIIYALTVNDVRRIAEWLKMKGIDAEAYHADLESETRIDLERRFQANELKVLCATTALGMGYDKGDVRFVIHFQRPGSIISYYQQVGRAGRAVPSAEVVLLEGFEDDEINEYFISSAFPDSTVFEEVKSLLSERARPSIEAITGCTNCSRGQIEKAVKLLEVSGAVHRDGRTYALVDADWSYGSLRSEEIMAARRRELAEMQSYAKATTCRMEYLAKALDDSHPQPCGRCDRCRPLAIPVISRDLILEAIKFLKRDHHVIEVKSFFPPGFLAEGRKKIPEDERLEKGVALSVYGDAGWGRLVREGKYHTGRYSDDLIEPCIEAVATKPAWVACVPSLRSCRLVPDFAERLAKALGIPFADCVKKSIETRPQKEMHNSTRQFSNAWDAFSIDPFGLPPGPCLLFDDVVDSGWTLTAIGVRLRRAGVPQVIPFALATARPRDDS